MTDGEGEEFRDTRDDFLNPSRLERVVGGSLIRRQLEHGARIDRERTKYGPEGVVQVCSARAILANCTLLGIVTSIFAAAGINLVALVLFLVLLFLVSCGILRCFSAAQARRMWRERTEQDD
jgi:hypothetical protein